MHQGCFEVHRRARTFLLALGPKLSQMMVLKGFCDNYYSTTSRGHKQASTAWSAMVLQPCLVVQCKPVARLRDENINSIGNCHDAAGAEAQVDWPIETRECIICTECE